MVTDGIVSAPAMTADTHTEPLRLPARIHPLPPALANQIAAGEVVERPASVAKELLENSLDAGARQVEIEVEEAGVRLLRVRDDGTGIARDDLLLAVARHATSKLRTLDDLHRVATLGFRGEALPSIASVSRFVLSSRPSGQAEGWQVRVAGGQEPTGPAPVAHPPGTTVEVRDLFFNVPARRKFLRSTRTELGHLEEVVRRLALARFDVGLRLRHEQRDLLWARPVACDADRARRVAAVCGAGFLEQALALERTVEGLRLSGWLGLPDAARSQADLQYLFINGRPVRDRLLAHAVRQGYEEQVYPGRFPAFVLYLELDPGEVDVNVHPTKQEVRFREARVVHDFVSRTVARALGGPDLFALGPQPPTPEPAGLAGPARAARPASAAAPVLREGPAAYRRPSDPRDSGRLSPAAEAPGREAGPRPLGLIAGRYLVAEVEGGLALVDAPVVAAVLAERRLRAARETAGAQGKPLLLPVPVAVGEDEAEAAERLRPLCAALGLDLERSGPAAVTVRRVPVALQALDPGRLARAALAALVGTPGDAALAAAEERLIQALARVAGEAFDTGVDPQAQGDLLWGLRAVLAEGFPPAGLWRVLPPAEIERLVGPRRAPEGRP
jgi:DNA mismatch repair protein MutL